MARYKKINLQEIRRYREARNETQAQFWTRFCVAQAGGSRFENGRTIPPPLATLLTLFLTGVIDDKMLERAQKGAGITFVAD